MDIKKMFWHLNLLFRTYKFKHIGSYCYMGKPLSLVGTQNISLGNRVRIYPGCRMETHKGGQIIMIAQLHRIFILPRVIRRL